jgi:hypothetical protein
MDDRIEHGYITKYKWSKPISYREVKVLDFDGKVEKTIKLAI